MYMYTFIIKIEHIKIFFIRKYVYENFFFQFFFYRFLMCIHNCVIKQMLIAIQFFFKFGILLNFNIHKMFSSRIIIILVQYYLINNYDIQYLQT